MLLCLQFLVGSTVLFEIRVALSPVLGGVRDVVSVIISHEQTQSNRVCFFQSLDVVLPKDLFCLASKAYIGSVLFWTSANIGANQASRVPLLLLLLLLLHKFCNGWHTSHMSVELYAAT